MKKILPTLILLLLLFCIVFSTTAQNNNYYALFNTTETQAVETVGLPTNRAAFIFNNNHGYSMYKNPAVAVLDIKNNHSNMQIQSTKVASVTSLIDNKAVEIKEEDICMFPNLTEDELWIKVNEQIKIQDEMNVEIYNENGERIYHSRFEKNLHKINLCNLMAGSFLVKLGDTVQKIIIE